MKLFLNSLFVIFLAGLISCNSNKNKDQITVTDDKGNKATIDISGLQDIAKSAEASQNKAEELKKMTPLTVDQLKAMIPEEFMGMKRSSFNANSMMGVASCNATYKSEDGKELKVNIFDCAGEAGAGIYTMRFWTLMNFQSEDDNGYQKTVDFNGQKAVESFRKNNDEYGLTYMSGDRLLVSVEGEKMGLEGVKQAAGSLNLKVN